MSSPLVEAGDRAQDIANQIENPDGLEGDGATRRELLFTPPKLDAFPHRDPDRLREAWEDSDTLLEAADDLDCSRDSVTKWLHVFGIRSPQNPAQLRARDVAGGRRQSAHQTGTNAREGSQSRRGRRRQPLPEDAQDMHCDDCDRYVDEWSFSPRGRPYCPHCGAIPEGAQREVEEHVLKVEVSYV